MSYDVLIVGAGIAGLSAAVSARRAGSQRVAVMTNRPLGQGGCITKVHGINAAFKESDQEIHFRETMASSKGLADPRLVEVLCSEISHRISDLEDHGLRFQSDESGYVMGRYGGCDEPRALNCLDFTGRELANTLGRQVLDSGCWILEGYSLVCLLSHGGECVGVLAHSEGDRRLRAIFARAVVLACGGGLSTIRPSTNPPEKYLAGISAAGRAGAELLDTELTQFHPTGLWVTSAATSGEIIEEELRTCGGVLINADGERFAGTYSPLREMATRDVVARAIALEVFGGRGVDGRFVWLDITAIDRELLARRFPYTMHRLRAAGHDMLQAPRLPVYPASHFALGGVRIDEHGAATVPYLYACGEDAGGVHGANRLGGNGVAESLVFGHRAGVAAARHHARSLPDQGSCEFRPLALMGSPVTGDDVLAVGQQLGPIRSGPGLRQAKADVTQMLAGFEVTGSEQWQDGETADVKDPACIEPWLQLQGLSLLIDSATARRECLGPHYRTDFPPPAGGEAPAGFGHTTTTWRGEGFGTSWEGPAQGR